MNIFYRPQYQSEATLFLEQLKAEHPQMEARQRQGLRLLWDKTVDRATWQGFRSARVAQKPYVYQNDPA